MPTAQASLRAVSPWRALQLVLQLEGVEYRPKCECRTARTKPEIALAEIDRVIAAGVRFGCVLADAGYGLSAFGNHAASRRRGEPRRRVSRS